MNISKFFINRPKFASVIAIIIVLVGALALRVLPVKEYPALTMPQVIVMANYPGADAETVAKTVVAPLEEAINGVKNMVYMSSSSSDGSAFISIFFDVGTDPDVAKVDVNNRVQLALSSLPEEVRRLGIQVRERNPDILRVYAFTSKGNKRNVIDLYNYVSINVVDDLKRVKGVGDVFIPGEKKYSIRVWLKPDKLAEYGLTPTDVYNAIVSQNEEFSVGQVAGEPTKRLYTFTYTVKGESRFQKVKQFENIILRSNPDGSSLKLKDVAKISLEAEDYKADGFFNGNPGVPVIIYLSPGANALNVAKAVEEKLSEISKNFPEDIEYHLIYDPTEYIQRSIEEVVYTLLISIALVVFVIYLFLGHARATIIPVLAIPVSLVGTFAGLYVLGFSVNLLTLFALVLAIGLVVDDAIVVIENVERVMRETGLSVKEATVKAMEEIASALIAIVIVLAAVFIPPAFSGGFTGEMFKQFAAAISISVILSGFVALTLTPALCAVILKEKEGKPILPVRIFQSTFEKGRDIFVKTVRGILKLWPVALLIYALAIFLTVVIPKKLPSGLVPMEDKGSLFILTYLMPGSSLKETEKVLKKEVIPVLDNHPLIKDEFALAGFDIGAFTYKTDSAITFAHLIDWDKRKEPNQSSMSLAKQLFFQFMKSKDAFILPVNPPPIAGMSITGGFEIYIQDRTGDPIYKLADYANEIVKRANQRKELMSVRTSLNVSTPQYRIELDRDKAKALGVNIFDAYRVLQLTFGRGYVNDFNLYGKVFHVNVQSEEKFRNDINDLRYVYVRSQNGSLVPVSSLIKKIERVATAPVVQRFNMFPAAKITGQPKPGYTSGQALKAIEEVAKEVLPEGYTIAYGGSSYQEKQVEKKGNIELWAALIFVYLVLVALYESWSLPISILMTVPIAAAGAYLGLYVFRMENDVYTKVGLITLIGLTAKNAILMVEFAEEILKQKGKRVFDAIVEAAKIRFRPIVMTSFAFIAGSLPLVFATGPGANSRHVIGHTVVWGMLAATTVGVLLIPVFYYLIKKITMAVRKGE